MYKVLAKSENEAMETHFPTDATEQNSATDHIPIHKNPRRNGGVLEDLIDGTQPGEGERIALWNHNWGFGITIHVC